MVQNVGMRLKGERGATFSMALLLMLVCAMASAIVIVASTVASGRMAEIAKMDQRYYAVTSAAEFLKDHLAKEDSYAVVTEEIEFIESSNTTSPTGSTDYQLVSSSDSIKSLTNSSNTDIRSTGYSGSKNAACSFAKYLCDAPIPVSEPGSNVSEWIQEWEEKPKFNSSAIGRILTLSFRVKEVGGSVKQSVNTTVNVKFNNDGSARITLESSMGASDTTPYIVTATLMPNFGVPETSVAVTDVTTTNEGGVTKTITKYRETKTTVLRWEVTNISSGGIVA